MNDSAGWSDEERDAALREIPWLTYSPRLDHEWVRAVWKRTFCRLGVHLFDQVESLEARSLFCDACERTATARSDFLPQPDDPRGQGRDAEAALGAKRQRSRWLEAIAARVRAASPGPWTARGLWLYLGAEWEGAEACLTREEDVEFIAHARSDLPGLLVEVERLREELGLDRAFVRRAEERFLAAAHELTKEVAEARRLPYREAREIAKELIETNYRLRTRPREEL